jgi:hypothetical protein
MQNHVAGNSANQTKQNADNILQGYARNGRTLNEKAIALTRVQMNKQFASTTLLPEPVRAGRGCRRIHEITHPDTENAQTRQPGLDVLAKAQIAFKEKANAHHQMDQ